MTPRPLREPFYRRLLVLGNGAIVLAPGKRDWTPLLKRGWVEDAGWKRQPSEACGFLPPLQITAEGLRALADWVDANGLPEIKKKQEDRS